MFGKDAKTDTPRSRPGRTPIEFLDSRILVLLDKQSFHSASFDSSIPRFDRESPAHLAGNLPKKMLLILETQEERKFRKPVAGRESWFTLDFHHSTKHSMLRDDVPIEIDEFHVDSITDHVDSFGIMMGLFLACDLFGWPETPLTSAECAT